MPAAIIATVNRKGGVGKTSATFHLGGYFASIGRRVLLVDCDPQHSLSAGIFGPTEADTIPADRTIAAVFEDEPSPEQVIAATGFEGLSIVPGSDDLTRHNLPDPEQAGLLQFALRDFLQGVADDYDVVLIDNPPNVQLCTWASLAAAEFALCVSQPEDYGSQGAAAVCRAVEQAQQVNRRLHLAGFLLNMVNARLSIHMAYEAMLRQVYGVTVFAARLPYATQFKEAVSLRKPLSIAKPRCAAAKAVASAGDELMARIDSLRACDALPKVA